MRTDVKIGLVCAFVIVMGAVIYFVAQPARPTSPKSAANGGAVAAGTGSGTPATLPASGLGGASSVGGPFILPPGPTAGTGGTDTAGTGSAGTPGLSGGLGGGFGTPSMSGGLGSTGTTGSTGFGGSALGSTGTSGSTGSAFGGSALGSAPTASTGGTGSAGTHGGTVDLSGTGLGASSPLGGMFGGGGSVTSTSSTTYVIKKDDMLGPIAKQHGVTVQAILAANPGLDPARLKIDHPINIPAGTATATMPPATAPSARAVHTDPATASTVSTAVKPGASYKIKKSDTLMTIARAAYGSDKDWKRIYQANKSSITDPNVVPVGLVIKIPQ